MSPGGPTLAPATTLVCAGCGHRVAATEPFPFACPAAGRDDIDHLLHRMLAPERIAEPRALFTHPDPNPFRRYRQLFHSYQVALSRGLDDTAYLALVDRLDHDIARVEGRPHGFRVTPFGPALELAAALGLGQGALWIKDETGNIAGSHKARHLMGLLLWLEMAQRTGLVGPADAQKPLAIASCGNAALAAAVVAAAGRRRLDVFVPPHVDPAIHRRLGELGAHLHLCPRQPGESGDPCFLRFREALDEHALPFTCQGSTNGLTLEGGQTLVWEMVSESLRGGPSLDRLMVQVGGGALASACLQGLAEARALGLLDRLPIVHAVQTRGAHPLERAWRRLVEGIVGPGEASPAELAERCLAAPRADREAVFRHAARHRSDFMWPWEDEPRSVASGILDDETYDWLAVCRGMVETGGFPLVVDEATLHRAHDLARSTTGRAADATGVAGLAGLIELQRHVGLDGETLAVLFTGRERG